jgi:hypothetical protein
LARANPAKGINKDQLLKIAPVVWGLSYQHTKDDQEAFNYLSKSLKERYLKGDDWAGAVILALQVPVEQIATLGSALWCDQGFPQIVMSHTYAASLLATKISATVLPYIQPPWRCFHIEVPSGLLYLEHEQLGCPTPVKGILVFRTTHVDGSLRWGYLAYTDSSLSLHRFGMHPEQLIEKDVKCTYDEVFTEKLTDMDARCAVLIGRLIFNVCLAYTEKDNITPPRERKNKSEKKRQNDLPTCRTYILGKDKKVADCRGPVKDYLTGRTSTELSVQCLVAGHWKSQPHGIKSAQRKVIWVEPYWRGPDDAPIVANVRVAK